MKKSVVYAFVTIIFLISGCKKGPVEVEERTVLLVDASYLKSYKDECRRQHGQFSYKTICDHRDVAANLYSNKLTTTEYLLICKKPKQTTPPPSCTPAK